MDAEGFTRVDEPAKDAQPMGATDQEDSSSSTAAAGQGSVAVIVERGGSLDVQRGEDSPAFQHVTYTFAPAYNEADGGDGAEPVDPALGSNDGTLPLIPHGIGPVPSRDVTEGLGCRARSTTGRTAFCAASTKKDRAHHI